MTAMHVLRVGAFGSGELCKEYNGDDAETLYRALNDLDRIHDAMERVFDGDTVVLAVEVTPENAELVLHSNAVRVDITGRYSPAYFPRPNVLLVNGNDIWECNQDAGELFSELGVL